MNDHALTPVCSLGGVVVFEDLDGNTENGAIGAVDDGDNGARLVFVRLARAQVPGNDRHRLDRMHFRQLVAGRHVPRVVGVLERDGVFFGSVEEDAGDISMRELLDALRVQDGALPVYVALALFRDICAPLATIEARADDARFGIDPSTMLMGPDGVVVSLVKNVARSPTALAVKRRPVHGTVGYLSPEEIADETLDQRAPMVGAGLLLFQLLAGRHPFQEALDTSAGAALIAGFREPVPSVASARADLPPSVVHLVERLTRRDRDRRYADWASVIAAIDAAAARLDKAPRCRRCRLCAGALAGTLRARGGAARRGGLARPSSREACGARHPRRDVRRHHNRRPARRRLGRANAPRGRRAVDGR